MSMLDKAKDKAEQLVGQAKEKLGQATDNKDLENSGKADQTRGEVKEAGHDVRDRAQGAVQDIKDKFDRR
ncbi:CsbD family protein [Actinokineospora guangxiensis]|uniref:CsbD family protein n=1 Tax=Actinokineospora guangxiensis TaxID=1490288 RepID=A0ABW0EXU8_9PSEU